MRVAAIDLGTNTARLIVCDCEGDRLERVEIRRAIVRLGAGLRRSGALGAEAAARALGVLREFSTVASARGAERVWAVGTSAVRDAGSEAFFEDARSALGFPLETITGEEEARIMAQGVQAGIGPVVDGMIIDIGGGSTETVCLAPFGIAWHRSLPEGVVHLAESFLASDPPRAAELAAVRDRCRALLESLPEEGGEALAATAGTPTTLAAIDLGIDDYDPDLINGHVLAADRVGELYRRLAEMPTAKRLSIQGMEKGREDLIVPGTLFLLEVMGRWGFPSVTVSDWGLLEGLALEAAGGRRGYGPRRPGR